MIICIQDDEWLDFVPFMASLLVNESDVCIDEARKIPDGRWYHFTKDQSWLALDMESKAGKVDVVRHRFYRNSLLWSLVVNQIRSADVLYEKKTPRKLLRQKCVEERSVLDRQSCDILRTSISWSAGERVGSATIVPQLSRSVPNRFFVQSMMNKTANLGGGTSGIL